MKNTQRITVFNTMRKGKTWTNLHTTLAMVVTKSLTFILDIEHLQTFHLGDEKAIAEKSFSHGLPRATRVSLMPLTPPDSKPPLVPERPLGQHQPSCICDAQQTPQDGTVNSCSTSGQIWSKAEAITTMVLKKQLLGTSVFTYINIYTQPYV